MPDPPCRGPGRAACHAPRVGGVGCNRCQPSQREHAGDPRHTGPGQRNIGTVSPARAMLIVACILHRHSTTHPDAGVIAGIMSVPGCQVRGATGQRLVKEAICAEHVC